MLRESSSYGRLQTWDLKAYVSLYFASYLPTRNSASSPLYLWTSFLTLEVRSFVFSSCASTLTNPMMMEVARRVDSLFGRSHIKYLKRSSVTNILKSGSGFICFWNKPRRRILLNTWVYSMVLPQNHFCSTTSAGSNKAKESSCKAVVLPWNAEWSNKKLNSVADDQRLFKAVTSAFVQWTSKGSQS